MPDRDLQADSLREKRKNDLEEILLSHFYFIVAIPSKE
jgi:hypothetical protein